jgi:DNA-binding protein HU-beta
MSEKIDNKTIINKVAESLQISQSEARLAFNVVKDSLVATLQEGKGFSIRGLGTFTIVERASRKGFNPSEKKEIVIPDRKAVKFKAAASLKKEIR